MAATRPARLLAPLALVVTAVALVVVLGTAGSGSDPATGSGDSGSAAPTRTARASTTPRRSSSRSGKASGGSGGGATRSYTVAPGDTPSAIASAEGVELQQILDLNPDIDPQGLTVGQKLKLPR